MANRLFFTLCFLFFVLVIFQDHLCAEIWIYDCSPEMNSLGNGNIFSFTSSGNRLSGICEVGEECVPSEPPIVKQFGMGRTLELKEASSDWSDFSCLENPSSFKRNLNLILEESQAEKDFWSHYGQEGGAFCRDIIMDYTHYYSVRNGLRFLIALGIAAPLANTQADMKIHEWYQDDIRSSGTDDFAKFWKVFGDGRVFLPLAGGLTLIAFATDENFGWMDQVVGEYGKNLARSYLVGGIPVLVMQELLGGDRPIEGSTNWTPFEHCHGVSGHAYIGATPFIMAAKMSNNVWVKIIFYTFSTFPAWSRINDGSHSLSQVGLGWFMAYMACEAVAETNHTRVANYMITPIFSGDTIGVNFTIRF